MLPSQTTAGASPARRASRNWPFSLPDYIPHLENGAVIRQDLDAFEASLLSTDTSVRVLSKNSREVATDKLFDESRLETYLKDGKSNSKTSEFFFINRYLVRRGEPWPEDSNKLRLSRSAFNLLSAYFELSPTFIASLANIHQPSGRGCPRPSRIRGDVFDLWFLLPVRVQVQCSDRKKNHVSGSAGKSQMNPLNYLHLAKPEVDVRGSHIAIYYRFDQDTESSSTIVFNFQDGRWRRVVEEPILRVKETLERASKDSSRRDPFYTQAVFLTSALRWWNNALNSFNDQLITYEEILLIEDQPSNETYSQLNSETNRALHCMTAHLHRYGSELTLLAEIVQDLKQYNTHFHQKFVDRGLRSDVAIDSISRSLGQITTQLSSVSRFRDELQLKTDNVLALLVDNAQVTNDRMLVENSKAMQAILKATQAEAEQSRRMAVQSQQLTEEMNKILQATQEEARMSRHMALQTQRLSEEMMKDSVAMKTIALLTAFFLPGTSFAAILAMPFFATNRWMGNINKFWVWVTLTVPSTTLCFMFYVFWGQKESKRKKAPLHEEEMIDLNGGAVRSDS